MESEDYAGVRKEVQKELCEAGLTELVTETSREVPDEPGVLRFHAGIHRICDAGAVQVEFETNIGKRRIRNIKHIKQVASREYAKGYIMGEIVKTEEPTSAYPDKVYVVAISLCMTGGKK